MIFTAETHCTAQNRDNAIKHCWLLSQVVAFCESSPLVTQRELTTKIIENHQGSPCTHLQATQHMQSTYLHLQEVLQHLQVAMVMAESQLLQPLLSLMMTPAQMVVSTVKTQSHMGKD